MIKFTLLSLLLALVGLSANGQTVTIESRQSDSANIDCNVGVIIARFVVKVTQQVSLNQIQFTLNGNTNVTIVTAAFAGGSYANFAGPGPHTFSLTTPLTVNDSVEFSLKVAIANTVQNGTVFVGTLLAVDCQSAATGQSIFASGLPLDGNVNTYVAPTSWLVPAQNTQNVPTTNTANVFLGSWKLHSSTVSVVLNSTFNLHMSQGANGSLTKVVFKQDSFVMAMTNATTNPMVLPGGFTMIDSVTLSLYGDFTGVQPGESYWVTLDSVGAYEMCNGDALNPANQHQRGDSIVFFSMGGALDVVFGSFTVCVNTPIEVTGTRVRFVDSSGVFTTDSFVGANLSNVRLRRVTTGQIVSSVPDGNAYTSFPDSYTLTPGAPETFQIIANVKTLSPYSAAQLQAMISSKSGVGDTMQCNILQGTYVVNGNFLVCPTTDVVFGGGCPSVMTALDEQLQKPEIHIYPNPASDRITVEDTPANTSIAITDMNGKTVMQWTGSRTVDISSLSTGIYLLKAGSTATKIVVTR